MTTARPRRLCRPYVLTGGRTRGRAGDIPLEATAITVGPAWESGRHIPPEAFDIAEMCARPHSVVEIASHLDVPPGVARVLVGDLAADRALQVGASTAVTEAITLRVDRLRQLLAGVRAL